MAKLLSESELVSMKIWFSIYTGGGSGALQTEFDDDGGSGSGGSSNIEM